MHLTRWIIRHRKQVRAHNQKVLTPAAGNLALGLLALPVILALIILAWRADVLTHYDESMSPMAHISPLEGERNIRFFDHTGQELIGELKVTGISPAQWSPLESYPSSLLSAVITLHLSELDRQPDQVFFPQVRGPEREEMAIAWQIAGDLITGDETELSDLTFFRRFFISNALAKRYERDFLLGWYLNTAYCGNLVFGLEPAASFYFDKSLRELTHLESAGLAIASKRHEVNPLDQPEESLTLANAILTALVDDGLVIFEEAEIARERGYANGGLTTLAVSDYSAFFQLAKEQLEYIMPPDVLTRESFDVYTTLDAALTNSVSEIQGFEAGSDLTALVFENETGRLLAIAPSDATLAPVPLTPLTLPFVAVTALGQGYTPASLLLDHESALQGAWLDVSRYSMGDSLGAVSLREAVAAGRLIPALQLADRMGDLSLMRTVSAIGSSAVTPDEYLTSPLDPVEGVYPLTSLASLGAMRGIAASDGSMQPVIIERITGPTGNIIWEYSPTDGTNKIQIFDPAAVYLINDILAPQNTTGGAITSQHGIAFITGRTPEVSWAAGYSQKYTLGIWTSGIDTAASSPLTATWFSVMESLHGEEIPPAWNRPNAAVTMDVCELSGLLPSADCPVYTELFISGTEPLFPDSMYRVFQVNRENGLLATLYTPVDLVETRTYITYPPDFSTWVREENIPQPPVTYDLVNVPEMSESIVITSPQPFTYQHGLLLIEGSVSDEAFKVARLDYGSGLNPQQWFQIGDNIYEQVNRGLLAAWEASDIEGLVVLRLTLIRQDNTLVEAFTQFTLDNTPPTAVLINAYPLTGEGFPAGAIHIEGAAQDSIGIDHVEFFAGETRIGRDDNAPYAVDFYPEGGIQRFYMAVYDLAGNMAISEIFEYTPTP